MARNLVTPDGSPSFDGVHPKLKKYSGYLFGYHKEEHQCRCCGKFTHYALHRRYKWVAGLEKDLSKKTSSYWYTTQREYDMKDRPWCCSDDCFKKMVFEKMFDCIIPAEEAEKILLGANNGAA